VHLDATDRLLSDDPGADVAALFHENSKTSRYLPHPTFVLWPSEPAVARMMQRLRRVKPFLDRRRIELPAAAPGAEEPVLEVLRRRESARRFGGGPISLEDVATVLTSSYGVNRDNTDTAYPRPFRMVPSGGALYPLELYLYAGRVDGLAPGLYHVDSEAASLALLQGGELDQAVAALFVQSDLVADAAAVLFVTAVFFRSTFKYGARGYRFVLLEAGHLAQNALLAATASGLAATPLGGFFDRDVDRFLSLDGVEESIVYAVALGTTDAERATPRPPA
jgi:SagB-type dehydrogenase family enzyme